MRFRSRIRSCMPACSRCSSSHHGSSSACDHSHGVASSPPMKSSFLPGCAHMYAYSERRLANFCQRSPGILSSSDRLPWTTSSCDSGRMKFSLNAYMSENVSWWWWKRR